MNKKLLFVINLAVMFALVLALMPMQGALASTKSGGDFKLVYPKTGEACEKYAKFLVMGRSAEAKTVEYTFYSWASGSPVVISTFTADFGQQVRIEYPGGVGNGRYSVVAVVYDAAGNRLWKKGAKWMIECVKAPRP